MKIKFNKHFSQLVHKIKYFDNAIIIAGLGRCGTTLLYDSLILNHYFKDNKDIIQIMNHKNNYLNGVIYKTHDYPPSSLPKNVKLIFMYGNPIDTVISSNRKINEWGIAHHNHLGSDKFKSNDDIFYKDTLELSRLFEDWNKPQNFEFASVRYESLYDDETCELLSEYLGFKLRLMPKKKRKTDWLNHPLKIQLLDTYGFLFDEIKNADDVKIWK